MLGSFDAPDPKIDRARRHLAELESEVAAFIESRPVRFETSVTEIGTLQRIDFDLHLPAAPGPLIGAIIGDVVHNLGASLDLTACDLVRWREGEGADVRRVYFPWCSSADQLDATILWRQLDRAGVAAVDIIRDLKPYPSGNPMLRAIHDLDVQDKHTALIPAPVCVGVRLFDEDGTLNPTVIRDHASGPSELRVVFPDAAPLAGRPVVETLRECIALTVAVMDRFRALIDA